MLNVAKATFEEASITSLNPTAEVSFFVLYESDF